MPLWCETISPRFPLLSLYLIRSPLNAEELNFVSKEQEWTLALRHCYCRAL